MKLVSASELAELSGKTWRTVSKRLRDAGIEPVKRTKKSDLYASDAALEAIFATEVSNSFDLQTERARLAKWQADKTEQDVEVRARRMLDADEVTDWVTGMLSTVKARLTQIPDATAQLIDPQHAPAIAEQLRKLVNEALEDLAAESERDSGAVLRGDEAATESDGERVGGSIPSAVERKQRRARPVAN